VDKLKGASATREEIDWNELWKRARLNYTLGQRRVGSAEFWDKRWQRCNSSAERQTDRQERAISKLALEPQYTVLDIGSGPGLMTVPLAKLVKHVTAVDFSPVALAQLQDKAEKEGLGNISCVNKKWEDVDLGQDIEQHDVIIASFCFTILDLKAALLKMNEAAKRAVYIFDAAGKKYWHHSEIWPRLYGEEFVPSPDYIYIVNLLYQMGIYCNVEIWEYEFKQRFSNLDEAVDEWKSNLEINTLEATKIIREYLSERLVREEGDYWAKNNQKVAMIWWEKQ